MRAVRLPTLRRRRAGRCALRAAAGDTGREALTSVNRTCPGLTGQLRTPEGAAHRFVNVYVDDDDVRYLDGLATKVGDGAEVSILPAVAGG